MLKRRLEWFEGQPDLDPSKLVFIDETGASTNLARKGGRRRRGRRLRAAVPHGHYKTVTLVGGVRLRGLVAPKVFDRPINAALFEEWVERRLIPTLSQGDIVVMDNLPAHKGQRVEELIKAAPGAVRQPLLSPPPPVRPWPRFSRPARWPRRGTSVNKPARAFRRRLRKSVMVRKSAASRPTTLMKSTRSPAAFAIRRDE